MITEYFQRHTSAAPLATFRVLFGLLLFASIVRFWLNGWIEELYIKPKHFFPYYGFEFVRPLGDLTYGLFTLCGACALLVAIGLFYRLAALGLFVTFTYIELIDKSTYLNHYYFISMLSLMMIFLPAHSCFSVDSIRNKKFYATHVPRWNLDAIRLFVCLLYFYAGLAKLNSDWLIHAQPLRTWLPAKNDLPFIGPLFNQAWVAYALSWAGCLYDLSIPFLLMRRQTRGFGFVAVVLFHALTAILFPIGMFPYIMIATATIFFSAETHAKVIRLFQHNSLTQPQPYSCARTTSRMLAGGFILFFTIQILLPFRYAVYPNELFWSEEGYRFSWRVMLMEKAGYAQFTVRALNGESVAVDNREFLTPLQEKMMATQPDMMLQYAHILKDHYQSIGMESPQVFVDSYVALNGRFGKPLVDPSTDLAAQKESLEPKPWILPFHDEITGF